MTVQAVLSVCGTRIKCFYYADQAESLGNEGKVEEAQIKTAKCDQLRVERLKLQEVTVCCHPGWKELIVQFLKLLCICIEYRIDPGTVLVVVVVV